MSTAVSNYIVMEMTADERAWVKDTLGSDASTNYEGLEKANAWYIVARNDHGSDYVEILPVVGIEATEPDREGFVLDGSFDDVAPELIRSGFPIHLFE